MLRTHTVRHFRVGLFSYGLRAQAGRGIMDERTLGNGTGAYGNEENKHHPAGADGRDCSDLF